jgi:hypothetical protein
MMPEGCTSDATTIGEDRFSSLSGMHERSRQRRCADFPHVVMRRAA